jgi:hypothetical protein
MSFESSRRRKNPSREKESGQTQDGFGHFLIMP